MADRPLSPGDRAPDFELPGAVAEGALAGPLGERRALV